MNKVYICIDLKSFYASVECQERGLDPIKTNLVVADASRTEKTICLATSPSLKKYGIPGRARLFEVLAKVKEINKERLKENNYKKFTAKSCNEDELKDKSLELDFIIAKPRMKYYMEYSAKIYNCYLKYVSKDDIYVYSIDEVFIDITSYLKTYKLTARQLITLMINEVYEQTGITATGGIGTNMYLAKVAMDIVAKHAEPNEYGVRIAGLDELTYKKLLWTHKPLTDFWRVGRGYAKKLEENNIYTMGDIARISLENEELLFKLFGINAEFLIDHAWGIETVTMKDIKSFKPKASSVGSGQVLHCPYDYKKAKLIVKEMTDLLVLDLVKNNYLTKELVLDIGYDIENLNYYKGKTKTDRYGRTIPKSSHGIIKLNHYTSSTKIIMEEVIKIYDQIINKTLSIRRINIVATNIIKKEEKERKVELKQINLFEDEVVNINIEENIKEQEKEEEKLQKTLLNIKDKYGKNSILKGMNLEEGGTTIERNEQVGGHSA